MNSADRNLRLGEAIPCDDIMAILAIFCFKAVRGWCSRSATGQLGGVRMDSLANSSKDLSRNPFFFWTALGHGRTMAEGSEQCANDPSLAELPFAPITEPVSCELDGLGVGRKPLMRTAWRQGIIPGPNKWKGSRSHEVSGLAVPPSFTLAGPVAGLWDLPRFWYASLLRSMSNCDFIWAKVALDVDDVDSSPGQRHALQQRHKCVNTRLTQDLGTT